MDWTIDPAHSRIYFTARHMMVTKVRGEFREFGGTVDFDPERPERSTVDVQVEIASINTRDEARDNHLRSADFFDAEHFPTMTFVSTKVKETGDVEGKLYGDLTIRGVTRPVVLDVEYFGQHQDPWGGTRAGFSASATINRKEWGLNWNVALETGGWLVSEKIGIEIELELIKVSEREAVAAAAD
jgi:polyisoprenoid-binding protein YceI